MNWGSLTSDQRRCAPSHPRVYPARPIARTREMAHIMDLPFEMLNTIITMVAMSSDGAKDLARASATCKELMTLTRQPDVLRAVNVQNLVPSHGCEEHLYQYPNGLLFRCVRSGNLAAECLLGKVILQKMILHGDDSLFFRFLSFNGLSQYQRFVRSFIRCSSCEDIAGMSFPLFAYITDLVGSDMACASGIFCAIAKLCIIERSISRRFQSLPRVYPFLKRATPAQLSQPPRERVLELFDMLFPPSPL